MTDSRLAVVVDMSVINNNNSYCTQMHSQSRIHSYHQLHAIKTHFGSLNQPCDRVFRALVLLVRQHKEHPACTKCYFNGSLNCIGPSLARINSRKSDQLNNKTAMHSQGNRAMPLLFFSV